MKVSIEYIKGWFDRSSSINIQTKSLIARSNTEEPARSIFAKLLQLEIDCSFCKYNQYEIRIGKKEALKKWRQLIGFNCSEKADKLDKILD